MLENQTYNRALYLHCCGRPWCHLGVTLAMNALPANVHMDCRVMLFVLHQLSHITATMSEFARFNIRNT